MIEPTILYGRSSYGWWELVADGFYAFSMHNPDEDDDDSKYKRYAVVIGSRIAVEIFPAFKNSPRSTHYYLNHGRITATRERGVDYMSRNHPEVAEWFLFHPELL